MKTVEIDKATMSLADCAREASQEPLVVYGRARVPIHRSGAASRLYHQRNSRNVRQTGKLGWIPSRISSS